MDLLVSTCLDDVVDTSPLGLGESDGLLRHELLLENHDTHDLKNLILPVSVRVVVDKVLCTELLRDFELRVRGGSHDDRGAGSESNLSTKATEMWVRGVQNETHSLTWKHHQFQERGHGRPP